MCITVPSEGCLEEVPNPTILEPTDVIARVDSTTICGTNLHILKGDCPKVDHGRILGHEATVPLPRLAPR